MEPKANKTLMSIYSVRLSTHLLYEARLRNIDLANAFRNVLETMLGMENIDVREISEIDIELTEINLQIRECEKQRTLLLAQKSKAFEKVKTDLASRKQDKVNQLETMKRNRVME